MVSESIVIVLCIFIILALIVGFALGFTIGKFRGAKDGIDYCFDQYEKKLKINKKEEK